MAFVSALILLATAALTMVFWLSRSRSDETARAVTSAPSPSTSVRAAIAKLSQELPSDLIILRDHHLFVPIIKSYWSSQAQSLVPAAIVRPETVQQVSIAFYILSTTFKSHPEPFGVAIRSGGHCPITAFANNANGIVIDLSRFNDIEISKDKSTVRLGVGARWKDVYSALDPLELTVAGGRASDVGVGGLTLGGGLSFHSSKVGFSCDNVIEFEVVLADGTVAIVNETSHADLLLALRGGGNNFAAVTSLTTRTFSQGKLWTGSIYHYKSVAAQLMSEWYDFCNPKNFDTDCTGMIVFGFSGKWQAMTPLSMMQSLKPIKSHPALMRFVNLKHFWSTMRLRTMTQAAADIGGFSPNGYRHHWHTSTFENDLEVMHYAYEAYKQSLDDIKHIKGVIWSLVFQPIFPTATEKYASNAIGLSSEKTLTIALIAVTWDLAKDDHLIFAAATRLFEKIDAYAQERGVFHPFKYVNYSAAHQKPYAGYGNGKAELLHRVSQKYDPDAFFQRAVTGGFKLGDT